jgi:hypothetical protein
MGGVYVIEGYFVATVCVLWVIWNMGETSEMPTWLVDAQRE